MPRALISSRGTSDFLTACRTASPSPLHQSSGSYYSKEGMGSTGAIHGGLHTNRTATRSTTCPQRHEGTLIPVLTHRRSFLMRENPTAHPENLGPCRLTPKAMIPPLSVARIHEGRYSATPSSVTDTVRPLSQVKSRCSRPGSLPQRFLPTLTTNADTRTMHLSTYTFGAIQRRTAPLHGLVEPNYPSPELRSQA